jgi:pyrroloquinoline-quinone synthase
MELEDFREGLLQILERKRHWAWPAFEAGKVPRNRLNVHLEQEYAVYVRDFPVFVGRAYIQCPIPEVRRDLAENLYEEETGALAAGRPHPELFLEIPRGLGMDLARFANVELLPAALTYRRCIDHATQDRGWEVAAAVSTLFLEGTAWERGELDSTAPKRPMRPLHEHPLVVNYGLDPKYLSLTKAHRQVEGGHRAAAWSMILRHVAPEKRREVQFAVEVTLDHWLGYRDEVAEACGLNRTDFVATGELSRAS